MVTREKVKMHLRKNGKDKGLSKKEADIVKHININLTCA